MSTRPLQLADENLPPRKRQRNYMNYDSNYISSSFTSPDNGILKNEISNTNEYKNNFDFTFKGDTVESNQDKKENVNNNINNTNNITNEDEKKDDQLKYDEEKVTQEVPNTQNEDQIDIIGNISDENDESEEDNYESEEEMHREEIKEFDDETKEKLRSEAHELGKNNKIKWTYILYYYYYYLLFIIYYPIDCIVVFIIFRNGFRIE